MPSAHAPAHFQVGTAIVEIYANLEDLGRAAANRSAEILDNAIRTRGRARLIVATGNSQLPLAAELAKVAVDWSVIEMFHMDEYVGMPASHPASFRRWIKERFEHVVHPFKTHYLNGDAPDLGFEILRYTKLLSAAPIDLAFVGIGENGHIANVAANSKRAKDTFPR